MKIYKIATGATVSILQKASGTVSGSRKKEKKNIQEHEELRWIIPPMVVHPEKIDFRRFV